MANTWMMNDVDYPIANSPESDTFIPKRSGISLNDLIPIELLQALQDRFAKLGQVTVIITTLSGKPITQTSWGSEFSRIVGISSKGAGAFAKDLRQLAANPNREVPSVCHPDSTLYVAPIAFDGQNIALMVVGTRPRRPHREEAIRRLADTLHINSDKLWKTAEAVLPWSRSVREASYRFADLLATTIGTLYGQAKRIRNQYDDLQVVHELAQMLTTTHNLQEILNQTVKRVVEVLHVKACAIRLLDRDSNRLVVEAVINLSPEYLAREPAALSENQIDDAAFHGETVYIKDARTDPRSPYQDNAVREGIVSGLAVPISYRGETIGVLRVYSDCEQAFDETDTDLLRSIGSQTASAILHSRLFEAKLTAQRIKEQVHHAGEIQRRMIPAKAPRSPFVSFGCVYKPTLDVGGDFYDFFELPQGNIGFCVADVVGKGLPAAIMMASIRAALRAHVDNIFDIDQIMAKVNHHLYRDTLVGEFATLFYGVLTPNTGRLTFCNAGHIAPLLLRGDVFEKLETGGMVLGVNPRERFERGVAHLQADDLLVMVTDGVTEALDFSDRAYGESRLRDSILLHRFLKAQHLAEQLLWDVRRFVGLADQSDDTSIMVMKYHQLNHKASLPRQHYR